LGTRVLRGFPREILGFSHKGLANIIFVKGDELYQLLELSPLLKSQDSGAGG